MAFRYRKRGFFLFGLLGFVVALYVLSSFVWLIQVSGNERILTKDVLSFCSEYGLKVGGLKYKINSEDLRKKLINHFPDISWIHVDIEGTRATIKLTEILPKEVIVDRKTPCDIIAKKDGLITNIITSAGSPKVKQNDVVKQGDLLVAGELIVKEDETGVVKQYIHAASSIKAKMYYDLEFAVQKAYTEKNYTQNIKKQYAIIILDKRIQLLNTKIPFTNYDKVTSRKQLSFGENYPLPIIFVTDECKEYTILEKTRNLEQMKELAENILTGRIIREFNFESDILDKKLTYTETETGLDVYAVVTTIESIGELRVITQEEGSNTKDGAATQGDQNSKPVSR